MANIEQTLQRLGRHRYSIKQLLALSGTAYNPFDLSKFSFDAARAGVIPSLGDCAASSRRSSATRPRDSSGESIGTVDEAVMFPRTETEAPERRPHPPPFSVLAQNHTGFARFLKKHTSPTHRRVTAGGRIVPIEPHFAPPPPFTLSAKTSTQPTNSSVIDKKEKVAATSSSRASRDVSSDEPRSVTNLQFRSSKISYQTRDGFFDEDTSMYNHVGVQGISSPKLGFSSYNNMPKYNSFVPPTDNLPGPHPGLMFGSPVAYNSWQPPFLVPESVPSPPMNVCSFGGRMMPAGLTGHVYGPSHLAQPIIWAQNTLSDWTQRYNELDMQLKALDRHRAMTNLTIDIASQRREIVQQRSDSKNMINLISTWLSMSEQVNPAVNTQPNGSSFNVEAPAYVPMTQQGLPDESSIGSCEHPEVDSHKYDFQKPPARSERRPIAIVPPPKLQIDVAQPNRQTRFSPESPLHDEVDSWGVKIGPAPPELRQQQSEILESISEVLSQPSHSNHSQESLQSVPKGGFFTTPVSGIRATSIDNQKHKENESVQGSSFYQSLDVRSEHRDNPETTQDSEGIAAHTQPTDEHGINTRFEGSQHSNSVGGLGFEQRFWDQSSTKQSSTGIEPDNARSLFQRLATTTPVSQIVASDNASSSNSRQSYKQEGKENLTVTPLAHRKAATDAFLARFNRNESQDEVLCVRNATRSLQDHSNLPENSREFSVQNKIDQLAHGRPGPRKFINSNDTPAQSRSGNNKTESTTSIRDIWKHRSQPADCGLVADPFNNKGYSSISVQNINVGAQLPQSLDGMAESAKSSRSVSTLTGRLRSPGLLRRTTTSGGA